MTVVSPPSADSASYSATADAPTIILDLSRLLSRVLHLTPTGIDRVEMAYARGLLEAVPDRLRFAAVQPSGLYHRLRTDAVVRFLARTEARWRSEEPTTRAAVRAGAARSLIDMRPRLPSRINVGRPAVYVQSSPHHLERPKLVEAIARRERAKLVCMVHDLIPLEYPEYARPEGALRQIQRIDTVVNLADGIIANSRATRDALAPYLAKAGRTPEIEVAHLGVATLPTPGDAPPARPYFVCLGTIESRKNHLLLLHLWRRMSECDGAASIPKLLVVGRRGWENEQVVDMLDRCPALVGCVEEHGGLSDHSVERLLAGARALLLPSFAEGYGMPVTEAIALGVPVVCSDLPALREAGGGVPEFLDPLDGPSWLKAIIDLASHSSAIAAEQRHRRREWRPPTWREHIAILLDLVHRVSR